MKKNVRELINQLKNIGRKGSFAQNVSIVFSGNMVNFGLQLIFAPLISRVFGPEAYGEYAIINLVISNITFFSALSLPSVYVIPKDKLSFLALGKVVFFCTLLVTLISLFIFLLFADYIIDQKLRWYTLAGIIILILLNTLNGILSSTNHRKKYYKKNVSASIAANIVSRPSTLGVGYYITSSGFGLLLGDFIRAGTIFLSQTNWKTKRIIFRFLGANNWRFVFQTWKDNINVLKYIFPSQIINKLYADIPIIVLGIFYNIEVIGLYAFSASILDIPKNLLSNAIRPVFFQKVTELREDKQAIGLLVQNIIIFSLIISIVPILILTYYGSEIFAFTFGAKWIGAGEVVSVISFYYILSTVSSSLQGIRRILNLEKQTLVLTIIGTMIRSIPFVFLVYKIPFIWFLYSLAFFNSLNILYNLSNLIYYLIPNKKGIILVSIITLVILFCAAIPLSNLITD